MVAAKITAVVGLALFVGGATGVLATTGLALGAVLLLVAATAGAVVLEGRDLDAVAGLVPRRPGETDASVIDLGASLPMVDERDTGELAF